MSSRPVPVSGAFAVFLMMLGTGALIVAACGSGGSSAGENPVGATGPPSVLSSPVSTSSGTTPVPLGTRGHSTREVKAMTLAQASVDEKRWAYDTTRYIGQTPDIVGYVVEWRRLGVALVATLVKGNGRMVTWADAEAGGGRRLVGRYVFDPIVYPMATRGWMSWTPQRASGASEGWAANTAGKALVEQRRNGSLPLGRGSGEPLVLAYYVGWPKVGLSQAGRPGLTVLVPADLRHGVVAPWGPSAW